MPTTNGHVNRQHKQERMPDLADRARAGLPLFDDLAGVDPATAPTATPAERERQARPTIRADVERDILQAVEENESGDGMVGQEIADAAGYEFTGRFRELLAGLVRHGRLARNTTGRGYVLGPDADQDVAPGHSGYLPGAAVTASATTPADPTSAFIELVRVACLSGEPATVRLALGGLFLSFAAEVDGQVAATDSSAARAGERPLAFYESLRDVSVLLAKTGHRLTTTQVLAGLDKAGMSHGDGPLKAMLANMVKRGVLTNCPNANPAGYGFPAWGQEGGE